MSLRMDELVDFQSKFSAVQLETVIGHRPYESNIRVRGVKPAVSMASTSRYEAVQLYFRTTEITYIIR